MAEVESLRDEVTRLKTVQIAFEAQDELVRALVSMGQAATGRLMLRSMLLQTVKIMSKLTQAEECSLFLLHPNGVVSESILARGATIREDKKSLIGQVLDKGLAGWVIRNRQIGLIDDTMEDERWLTLPNQPYTVRSALCLPILRGKILLGILTLTHPEPRKFTPEITRVMQMTATQMALALDNARLYMMEHQPTDTVPLPQTPTPSKPEKLSRLGIYILDDRGKFIYANPRLAEIFDYDFADFASLDSVLALVNPSDRDFLAEQMNHCLNGHAPRLACKFKGQQKQGSSIEIEIDGTRTKFYGKYSLIGTLRSV